MLAPALDCEFPPEEEVEEVRTDWMYLNIWDRMGSTWREKAKVINYIIPYLINLGINILPIPCLDT